MNMNADTPIESAINRLSSENDCYGTDSQVAALNVITDYRRSYQLAYAHFLYSELAANPGLEIKPDAPPQQLVIHFSMAVVTVLGAALHQIEKAIQKNHLKHIQLGSLDGARSERRSPNNVPVVVSVAITFTEDKP
jgi:hypothetical protein